VKVTLLQTNIHWAEVRQNIAEAEQLMAAEPDSDLYVLPEMWTTGFATQPHGIAHSADDNTALQWMRQTARQRRCAISGSVALQLSDGTFRNRHYFVDGRADAVYYYDKHHLFTYGHENQHYAAGDSHTVVHYCGMRLLLLTCYDLRFPCWSRYSDSLQYDAIVLVANWPQARQSAWHLLIRARAIENQCYVVAVNRVGDDCFGHYVGCSAAIDPIGRTLAQCQYDRQHAVTADLDLVELERRRQKFRVLEDRD